MKNIGKILVSIFVVICLFLAFFLLQNGDEVDNAQNTVLKNQNTKKNIDNKTSNFQISNQTLKNNEFAMEKEKLEKKQKFAKLSTKYRVSCAPCHGLDGKGEIAPVISGKSQDEILKSLDNFKKNTISNTLMSGLLKNLTNDDLKELANEISKFE